MANEELLIHIGADVSDLDAGVQKANKGIGGLIGGVTSFLGPVGLAVTAVGGLGGAFSAAFGEATEAQEGLAQLDAVLTSTGGKAGVTKDQVLGLADSLSASNGLSKFTDDAILSAENMLLTFTNIGAETFPMATQAVLDMSQATGGDMVGASVQLGKALNDPIAGVGALSKVGVTFTDSQKEVIKALVETGDVAGAQKIILNELAGEFGGSAAAAADTFGGKMVTLQEKFNGVLQAVGEKVLPIVTEFVDFLLSADFASFVDQLTTGIGGAITFVTQLLGPIIETFQTFFNDLKAGKDPIDAIIAFIGNLGNKIMELGGKVLQAIIDALPGIMAKLGEWGQAFIAWVAPRIGPMLLELGKFLLEIAKWIITVALPTAIQKLGEFAQAFLGWVGRDVLPFIGQKLGELAAAIWAWVTRTAADALQKLRALGSSIVEGIKQGIANAWNSLVSWATAKAKELWDAITGVFQPGSPAKVAIVLGGQIAKGFEVGITGGLAQSQPAIVKAFTDTMSMIDKTVLGGGVSVGGASPRLGRGGAGGVNLTAVFQVDGERIPVRIDRVSNGLALDQAGYRRLPTGWSAT